MQCYCKVMLAFGDRRLAIGLKKNVLSFTESLTDKGVSLN